MAGKATIDKKMVTTIRKKYATGRYSYNTLAKELGLTIMIVRYWVSDENKKLALLKSRDWQEKNRDKFLKSMRDRQQKQRVFVCW